MARVLATDRQVTRDSASALRWTVPMPPGSIRSMRRPHARRPAGRVPARHGGRGASGAAPRARTWPATGAPPR